MLVMRETTIHPAATPFSSKPILSDLYPLDAFYAARGLPLPAIGKIDASEVPEPYHSLLVHNADMTSKLEAHHKSKVHIQLLARHAADNEYFREVVLVLNHSLTPVEFGAIKIVLDLFPVEAQQEILKEHRPLGQILTEFKVAFSSRPRAYLRIASDKFMDESLNLRGMKFLYGRRNTLVDAWDRPLAEIVEILPPT